MAMLTIRKIPDEVHRALRTRATRHGRSTEAEVREILVAEVKAESDIRLGDALVAMSKEIGLTNEDVEILEQVIAETKTIAEPWEFE